MNEQAQAALAGDAGAQAETIADYARILGPEAAGALRARFAFDADIDALVAQARAGDPAAADEAFTRVQRELGPAEVETLRARLRSDRDDYPFDDVKKGDT
jgi:hypothetical protein